MDVPAGSKEKVSFNFSIAGRGVPAAGVGGSGCSAELALDMEGVRPGMVSCDVWLSSGAAVSWVEADLAFGFSSFLSTSSSKIAILAPIPKPFTSGRLRMTSSIEIGRAHV